MLKFYIRIKIQTHQSTIMVFVNYKIENKWSSLLNNEHIKTTFYTAIYKFTIYNGSDFKTVREELIYRFFLLKVN